MVGIAARVHPSPSSEQLAALSADDDEAVAARLQRFVRSEPKMNMTVAPVGGLGPLGRRARIVVVRGPRAASSPQSVRYRSHFGSPTATPLDLCTSLSGDSELSGWDAQSPKVAEDDFIFERCTRPFLSVCVCVCVCLCVCLSVCSAAALKAAVRSPYRRNRAGPWPGRGQAL